MQDYAKVCEKAVRAGGATVQGWIGRFQTREKGPADLVTEADLASQQVVRDIVLGDYPDHCLLGEEGDDAVCPATKAEYRWIVDPLDGTTNFVHQVPHYCVSLALERRGELLVAAVFDPTRDECFTAVAGEGAFLNGEPLRTSTVTKVGDALAAVGFPPGNSGDAAPDLAVFLAAIDRCQAIRRTGSAALNLCYLAAGRFDLFWSFSTKVWDVAAGILILREAGGIVTAPDGTEFILDEACFLAAANKPLHSELEDLVASVQR